MEEAVQSGELLHLVKISKIRNEQKARTRREKTKSAWWSPTTNGKLER
jgi:hypothetical protein